MKWRGKMNKVAVVLRNLVFFVAVLAVVACTHLAMCARTFDKRGTTFVVMGRMIAWTPGTKQVLGYTVLGSLLVLCLISLAARGYAMIVKSLVAAIPISLLANYWLCNAILVDHGVGTIRSNMETELWQEDLSLRGELGVYGGYFESTDGADAAYYICDRVDAYGPFSYQVIRDWDGLNLSNGDEFFASSEEDGLIILKSVTLREYDDGFWVIAKEFVSAEDVRVDIEHIGDLQKYVLQAKYALHRGQTDSHGVISEMHDNIGFLLK